MLTVNNPLKILIYIIILAFALRLLFVLVFIDLQKLEYYEYGNIVLNIHNGNGYSLFHFEDTKPEYRFNPEAEPHKSAYMPPGYIAYLYPFFFINNVETRNFLIILSQILLSCLLVYLVYKFVIKIFNYKTAIISAAITAILPEFIYSASTIQVTVFYHLLAIAILYLLTIIKEKENISLILIISVLFTIAIYFRSEFLLFAGIIFLYFIYKKMLKKAIIFIITIIILILPWQIRNYYTFNEPVAMTTNSGLNLYRGHNPHEIGAWGDSTTEAYLYSIKDSSDYELLMDRMYLTLAINNIKKFPLNELINIPIKLFHIWFIDPNSKYSFNIFYIFPWVLLLGFSLYGIIKNFSWRRFKFIYLFIIYSNIIAVLYFVLPRYQTMMKIALIPFAAYSINLSIEKFKGKLKKESN